MACPSIALMRAGSSWMVMGASRMTRGFSWVLPANSATVRLRVRKPRWLMTILASAGVSSGILSEKTPSALETLLILLPDRLTEVKNSDSELELSRTCPCRVITPVSWPAAERARNMAATAATKVLIQVFILFNFRCGPWAYSTLRLPDWVAFSRVMDAPSSIYQSHSR